MKYSEQLKDPRWQRKRLEIMQRDDFQCQCCFDRDNSLNVHHKEYIKSLMTWEYDDKHLITLCEDCHDRLHTYIIPNELIKSKCNAYNINTTDYMILWERFRTLSEETGGKYMDMVLKNLTAMVITKDKI